MNIKRQEGSEIIIEGTAQTEYIKKNMTKEWLLSNGFYYNRLFSDDEAEVYTYRFPV